MRIDITLHKIEPDEKISRYVQKIIDSLDKHLEKVDRDRAVATVTLSRVDRAHGNKYEAAVALEIGETIIRASDSTLNVLAALDIVRAKLARDLKKDGAWHLPRRQKRV